MNGPKNGDGLNIIEKPFFVDSIDNYSHETCDEKLILSEGRLYGARCGYY